MTFLCKGQGSANFSYKGSYSKYSPLLCSILLENKDNLSIKEWEV